MSSRLAEVYRDYQVHVHQNSHIDLESLREVPESHAWPPLDDYPSKDLTGVESVPVIDLTDPEAMKLVGHACMTWGAFQVTNHGIPVCLLNHVESESRRLFSLPPQQKLKAARSPNGISGYGLARISSFFPKLMWSEGFTIVESPTDHARQLWPQDYNNFCEVMEEYEKKMKQLARRLLWLMMESLGINKEDIKWAGPTGDLGDACAALQLNSYPACPEPNRAMGLAAHTDSTLLTVLYQNSTSGLQVLREGAGWVTVPPLAGGLVVNVGDLLHILSNGQYQTVLHRVVVNCTHHRLSIAYLYGPPTNVQISPLSRLVQPSQPPLFRPVTWTEYLRAKAKHFNKTLSLVRLCSPLHGLVEIKDNNSVKVV
ncbi:gibberellin 3-beta-dioxygenase 1-like [Macadamia integrifolia]|uniref:gibberellin 3-beta-dioxygenase 1-like n=1 Tax=Macadamia integrifolia TaxID=60698 RepID=UPI001C4E6401|nr:gibberellin 3-beta-dioxygenase 1-like [Macadamia integrifolia]